MLTPAPDWYGTATTKKKPPYTQADIDASLAANPYASKGGYEGPAVSWQQPWEGGKISIPGTSIDYGSLIASDPNLLAGSGDVTAQKSQLEAQRRAVIQQAVIRSGFGTGAPADAIDQTTLDAAAANQFSTKAELDRAKTRSSSDLDAALAARGILGSGASTGGQQRIQEGYERGTSQATQALLDTISGVESQTAQGKYALQQQIMQLREAAAQRIAADPRYQPLSPTDAVLDPGSGLYVTPDGRWYDSNGNRANPPAAAQPPASAAPAPAAAPQIPGYLPGGRLARDEIYAGL